MAKYCKTYKILCVCPTCRDADCVRSPQTRAEAEISRSCQLREDGSVVGESPAGGPGKGAPAEEHFSPSRKVPLPPLHPPRRGPSRWWIAASLTFGLLIIAGTFHIVLRLQERLGTEEEEAPSAEAELVAVVEEEPAQENAAADAGPEPPAREEPPALFSLRLEDLEPLPRRSPSRQTIEREDPFQSPRFVELKSRGNEMAREGNFAGARRIYQEIIETSPSSPVGYNNLANTFSDEGNHSAAEPIYFQSLRYDPNSPTIHFNLGNNYLRAGRWADAEGRFLAVLGEDPGDWEALLLLGIAYYHQERWREASECFLGVLNLNPESAEACFNLYLTYRRVGATHLARSYLSEAYRLDPSLRDRG